MTNVTEATRSSVGHFIAVVDCHCTEMGKTHFAELEEEQHDFRKLHRPRCRSDTHKREFES